jgi:hypothetical protein
MPKQPMDWMQYSGVGIQMAVTMLLCLWLGSKAEELWGFPSPWGQLGGLFLGVFASIYNLIKSISK